MTDVEDTGVTTATPSPPVDPRLAKAGVGMVLSHWAAQIPDTPAIRSPEGDRTFAELNANANRLVRALRRRGVRTGDAVALLCSNRPEFVETVQATQRAGLRLTPVNCHLTGDAAAYILADCEATAVVARGLGCALVFGCASRPASTSSNSVGMSPASVRPV